jgi:hypothetical protein
VVVFLLACPFLVAFYSLLLQDVSQKRSKTLYFRYVSNGKGRKMILSLDEDHYDLVTQIMNPKFKVHVVQEEVQAFGRVSFSSLPT